MASMQKKRKIHSSIPGPEENISIQISIRYYVTFFPHTKGIKRRKGKSAMSELERILKDKNLTKKPR